MPVIANNTGKKIPPPVEGNFAATGVSEVFDPLPGVPVRCRLVGNGFTGTVTVERTDDKGSSWQPMTAAGAAWASFTDDCNEEVDEPVADNVQYRLNCSALTAGDVDYRLGH